MVKRAKQARPVSTAATVAGVTKRVFDEDAQTTVGNAIHAFYRIRRLALRALDDSDAESFCMAIAEISLLHGKAIDDCVTRVTGCPGVGCFDKYFIGNEAIDG
jgi:hypothetical protein